MYKLLIIN